LPQGQNRWFSLTNRHKAFHLQTVGQWNFKTYVIKQSAIKR
jgi:hypothetical protein